MGIRGEKKLIFTVMTVYGGQLWGLFVPSAHSFGGLIPAANECHATNVGLNSQITAFLQNKPVFAKISQLSKGPMLNYKHFNFVFQFPTPQQKLASEIKCNSSQLMASMT